MISKYAKELMSVENVIRKVLWQSEATGEISNAEKKIKVFKDVVISWTIKNAFLAPLQGLNLARDATVSPGTARSPALTDSGSTRGPEMTTDLQSISVTVNLIWFKNSLYLLTALFCLFLHPQVDSKIFHQTGLI